MKTKIYFILICLLFSNLENNLFAQICQVTIVASQNSVCDGAGTVIDLTAQLDATDTDCDGTFDFEWSTGESTSSITVTPTNGNNTYFVTITDQNDPDNTSMDPINIAINDNPSASFSPNPSSVTPMCDGTSQSMMAVPSGGSGNYVLQTWSSSNSSVVSVLFNAGNASLSAEGTGNATITYEVTDNNGCTGQNSFSVQVVNNPSANITGDNTVCEDENSTFDGNPSGGTSPYQNHNWSSNVSGTASVSSGNETTPVISGSSGTAIITYVVTDANGCTASDTRPFTVFDSPTVTITGDDNACDDVTFASLIPDVNGGTPPLDYNWGSSNSSVGSISGNNPGTLNIGNPGTTNISLTVSDFNNCSGTATVFPFEVFDTPSSSGITGPDDVCMGESVTLNGNASGSGINLHVWTSSNPSVATVNSGNGSTTLNAISAGFTTITYTASTGSNCSVTVSTSFEVFSKPEIEIIGVNNACQSEGSVQLIVDLMGGTSPIDFSWNSSNTNVATISGNNPVTLNFQNAGMTNITLTVSDANDCGDVAEVFPFEVFETPSSSGITGPNNACMGESIILDGNASGNGISSHLWISSNPSVATVSSGAGTTSLNTESPGNVTITYTAAAGTNCSVTVSHSFEVLERPNVDLGANLAICSGGSVDLGNDLTVNGGDNPLTYSWDNGLGNVENPTVQPNSSTTYTLTVTDANQCAGTDNIFVDVFATPTVAISGTSSACAGDGATLLANASEGPGTIVYIWEQNSGSGWGNALGTQSGNSLTISDISNSIDFRVTAEYSTTSGLLIPGCDAVMSDVHTLNISATPAPQIISLSDAHCQNAYSLFYNQDAREGSTHYWSITGASVVQDTIVDNGLFMVQWSEGTTGSFTIKLVEVVGDILLSDCKDSTTISIEVGTGVAPDPAIIFFSPIGNTLVYNDQDVDCYQWGTYDYNNNSFMPIAGETYQSYVASETYNEDLIYWCQAWNGDCNNPSCSTTAIFREDQIVTPPILEDKKFQLYPNPNAGNFTLDVNKLFEDTEYEIKLFNLLGQTVYSEKIVTQGDALHMNIQMNEHSTGVYYMGLFLRGERQKIVPFVVQ